MQAGHERHDWRVLRSARVQVAVLSMGEQAVSRRVQYVSVHRQGLG
jgi:hypothetical protein